MRLERDDLAGRLAEFDGIAPEQLEAHRVASALGVEATHVLEAAHLAATERAERAEREADAVRDAAVAAAAAVRTDAQTARDDLIEEARREAETIVEEGRQRGREMVNEAQTVRERMLRDLGRKRQAGRAQVEQLRAGRDRLLESLTTAQNSLDTAVDDLVNSVPEARAAAERAGLRVKAEPTPTPDELEGEIESARLVGHPILDELPQPVALDSDPFPTGETEALTHLDDVIGDVTEEPDKADDSDRSDGSDKADDSDQSDGSDRSDDSDQSDPEDGTELFDIEAEDGSPDDAGDPAEASSDAGDDLFARVGSDPGDGLFARLRSSHAQLAEEEKAEDEKAEDHEAEDDEAEDDEAEDEPPGDELAEDDDGLAAARTAALDTAAATATRAMKKVLLEEQGSLLDGIRRRGADALAAVIDDTKAHESPYDKAATPAFRALVTALGGPKRLNLRPALTQLHVIALEPVRQRLAEAAQRVDDDADELSEIVRALYRESRTRRISEAAAAAALAVAGLVVLATVDSAVRWVVDDDGPCGPDCADNALAGDVPVGDEFPTGDRYPPAHAACTCRLVAAAPVS